MAEIEPSQLNVLIERDGYLTPQIPEIKRRYKVFRESLQKLQDLPGGLDQFTLSYREYGVHLNEDNSISCLEWCPGVQGLSLVGDFSKIFWT
uniref:Uncharacterized protein n=1 Tax=Panagrolaimus davidi TaxID=227884 RepID=A0A914P7P2_9BILA